MAVSAITHVGAMLADPTRATLLVVLLDGRARTGGELARLAGVAPSTASEHLARLGDAGFVAVEAQGRHRYFRLAGPEVAQLIESLGALDLPAAGGPVTRAPSELLHARSCYDHLAGRLGVELFGHLVAEDDDGARLTDAGERFLLDLGVDMAAVRRARRPTVRACLDWTERRHHLGGGAGAALFKTLLDRGHVRRGTRPRSVVVTRAGERLLQDLRAAAR